MNPSAHQTAVETQPSSIFDPRSAANPYPLYVQLHASGAVVPMSVPFANTQTPGTAWMVTQYPEAVQVLKDPRFTVDATAIDPRAGVFGQSGRSSEDGAEELSFLGAKSMISVDGAEHTRLRGLASRAFTPRYIETWRPRIQQIADAARGPT